MEALEKNYFTENMKNIKKKVLVMSGKGGVGKSTIAVNLAYALALKGFKTGLLDIDIHGPSIAKMTNIEGKKIYVDENEEVKPIKIAENIYALSIGALVDDQDEAFIWRGPVKIGVIKQFLENIKWPELDCLVIDNPPGTGDEPLTIAQLLGNVDGAIIVSTPQDLSFLDARKSINFCKKLNIRVLGIVENMIGYSCPSCGHTVEIFKRGSALKASKDFNTEIIAEIPIDPEIAESGDSGKPYVYFFGERKNAEIYLNLADKIIETLNKS